MELFSRFKNEGHDSQTSATVSSVNVSSIRVTTPSDLTLTDSVERCIYANAKYIGSVALVVRTRSHEGLPDFIGFLNRILEVLPQSLYRFQMTDAGRNVIWLQPEEYSEFFRNGSSRNWSTYVEDCGTVAYVQEMKGQGRDLPRQGGLPHLPINWPSQFAVLESSSEMAITQCLTLLKAAQEKGDSSIKMTMLDNPSYLLNLVLFYLVMQMNMFHMHHQNGVMFISNDLLEKPIQTSFQFFETDVNPDAPVAMIPQALASLIYIPNEDGTVALGWQTLAGRQGIIARTNWSAVGYLKKIADNFNEGLKQQFM
ncbi:MAG: hypothetical protein RSC68_24860 [Acinetobacter sp.]